MSGPIRLVVQSELVANEALPDPGLDPRTSPVLNTPLVSEEHVASDNGQFQVILGHRTRRSGLRLTAGMAHDIEGPELMSVHTEAFPDAGRCTVTALVSPGARLRIVKYIGYGWSTQRSRRALHDEVTSALTVARLAGWSGLQAEQRRYLDEFWAGADVETDGDPEIQQAVRFGLFHILQAGARAGCRPIAAKGLTGPGYDGHTFWDTETFVLPVLTYTQPGAAANVLRWRHTVLPEARQRAACLGLAGAAFPWRTIQGQECSGYWPAGTAAFHINADVAVPRSGYVTPPKTCLRARHRPWSARGDGATLAVELGHHDRRGTFASTVSPGPTNTAPLGTTTSTRT